MLIELDINHPDYKEAISLIISYGFHQESPVAGDLVEKTSSFQGRETTLNHIFLKAEVL